MTEGKLNIVSYQPDHLWTGSKTIRKLHKTMSILRKDVKSRLVKQALRKVLLPLTQVIKHLHYEKAKPNQQHKFFLLFVPRNVYERNIYK